MKYMGSKTTLLKSGLADLITAELADRSRFVDLFSGSGAVASLVAETHAVPVIAVDMQEYGRILSGAVIDRAYGIDPVALVGSWFHRAKVPVREARGDASATSERSSRELSKGDVLAARKQCAGSLAGFITRDYGGHYFSPAQALALDALYGSLPPDGPERTVCLAALIRTASKCAAAPGHTAQPFQPTERLLPYIESAWSKDVFEEVEAELAALAPRHARVAGTACTGGALAYAEAVEESDLVFCDPPYSAAQYSRFYHVLEGIARGGWDVINGAGRAPEHSVRASSEFSLRRRATGAMESLLAALRMRGCRVVVTFPDADASNGLSAAKIAAMAMPAWTVETHYYEAIHSTLGGQANVGSRGARRSVKEAVLVLNPTDGCQV